MKLQDMNLPPPRRNGISLADAKAAFNEAGDCTITLGNGVLYTKNDRLWQSVDGTAVDHGTGVKFDEYFEARRHTLPHRSERRLCCS